MTEILAAQFLVRKLQNFTMLSDQEKRALCNAISQVRHYGCHEDVISEGDLTGSINILLSGYACRQKMLPDGRRQIIGLMSPGDISDVHVFLRRRMDHTISTVSPARVGTLPREVAIDLTERYPRLSQAWRWSTMVEESIAREWLINVGQRTALERLAHLFCEIYTRLAAVGLTVNGSCELPLTQGQLADILALSTVHVNRTLQELRQADLVSVRDKTLTIHDFRALQTIGMFDPNYLHLGPGNEGIGRSMHAVRKSTVYKSTVYKSTVYKSTVYKSTV
jgi:CRP-like cAMP-binding protein